MTSIDKQVGGSHYRSMVIQPIEFIMANGLGFCEGNAIKYICRFRSKNGIEDLEKAKHYIDMLIEMERKKQDAAKTTESQSNRSELDRWSDDGAGVREGMVSTLPGTTANYGLHEVLSRSAD